MTDPKTPSRTPTCWHWDQDAETLWGTQEEAIDHYLSLQGDPDIPSTLTLYGYAPMVASRHDCGDPLQQVLEALDEQYANPDGDGCEPTAAMKAAETTFLAVILREYTPWMCALVCEVTVPLTEEGPRGQGIVALR